MGAKISSVLVVNHGAVCPPVLETSSSRCTTESNAATHDFEVTSYTLLDGLGVGNFVTSSIFTVGGYDWCITFYPDGVNKDSTGNASAYLHNLKLEKMVRTRITLNMLEKEGEVPLTNFPEVAHVYSPTVTSAGYCRFVNKSKLKSLSGLNNGCFTIRCALTVIKEPCTEVRKRNLVVVVPQPNLQEHLRQMWKDGEGADVVTFSVSGELFNAHRCLLAARSPVFKAELFGPMKEKATQCITIDDIEPMIFEALLHFIYTDCMLEVDDGYKDGEAAKLQHLLVAADRYGVERLRAMCESKLCESIDVETVASTLVLAEQHHCRDLRQACIEFMASPNMIAPVLATDGFRHLEASCPLIMKDILLEVSRAQTRTSSLL